MTKQQMLNRIKALQDTIDKRIAYFNAGNEMLFFLDAIKKGKSTKRDIYRLLEINTNIIGELEAIKNTIAYLDLVNQPLAIKRENEPPHFGMPPELTPDYRFRKSQQKESEK